MKYTQEQVYHAYEVCKTIRKEINAFDAVKVTYLLEFRFDEYGTRICLNAWQTGKVSHDIICESTTIDKADELLAKWREAAEIAKGETEKARAIRIEQLRKELAILEG